MWRLEKIANSSCDIKKVVNIKMVYCKGISFRAILFLIGTSLTSGYLPLKKRLYYVS